MSTQCRFCGEAVRPDSMFCPACGQLIGAVAGAVPPFPGADAAPAQRASSPAAPAPVIDPVPLPHRRRPGAAPETQNSANPVDPEPIGQSPQPGERAAASAEHAPTAVVLPDGQRAALDSILVFGRAPEQGAAAHNGVPIMLNDPQRAMSRVHLVVAPVPGGVTATDPGSANGTLLERDGTQYALVSGTPTNLLPGDRLLLGDAVLLLS